jgi:hypothetical protein
MTTLAAERAERITVTLSLTRRSSPSARISLSILYAAEAPRSIRRSGPISEKFEWDVDFGTTYDQIEQLRDDMLAFLEQESRDFQTKMDGASALRGSSRKLKRRASHHRRLCRPGQAYSQFQREPLTHADRRHLHMSQICYKSNWQNGVLKVQRRNKFVAAILARPAHVNDRCPGGSSLSRRPWPSMPSTGRQAQATCARIPKFRPLLSSPQPAPAPADPTVVKLLQAEQAPAYERRTSPDSGAASQERVASPIAIAATLQNRGAAIEDASTDIFRGKGGRRASVSADNATAPMRAAQDARVAAYAGAAGSQATTANFEAAASTSGGQAMEMHQR